VQCLVVADVSAVVFTSNPVTGDRSEVVINATWGLGESLVDGTVTPDALTLRKSDCAVTHRCPGAKRRMTVAVGGGTEEVEVPGFLRAQPALSDSQAIELAHLGLRLEETMGRPVDVECALRFDRVFLLQCRAITTAAASAA
jgi:pyruvate,water dikinase